jgi:hypothetical protein
MIVIAMTHINNNDVVLETLVLFAAETAAGSQSL